MKLSEVKQILPTLENVEFQLENGTFVPKHFHVTEVGMINKNFIDCGGVIRSEKVVNFQLWNADDFEHRLSLTNYSTLSNSLRINWESRILILKLSIKVILLENTI
jgi:hypothetical protein